MDNNPNQSNQLDQDDPVFSSSDLTQTKARKDTHFFTNVQKATLGQKISNWFNKLNRESLEHSAARKAAFKAKLEERRRAADLAAISAAVPEAPAPTRPTTSAPAPTTPPTNAPTQPTPMPTAPAAPAPAPAPPASAPAPVTPAPTPNQQPAPTIIIEDTPQSPRKSRRTLLIAIITVVILLLALIITLLILKPWQSSTPTPPTEVTLDRYDMYEELGPAGIDEYYAAELADATDTQARNAVLAQKIAFYSVVFDLDAALAVMDQIDFDDIAPFDLYTVYLSMNTIYEYEGDTATADAYYEQAMAIPGLEEYQLGGS